MSIKECPLTKVQSSHLRVIRDGLKNSVGAIIDFFLEFSRFEAKEDLWKIKI